MNELLNYFYPPVEGMKYVAELPQWGITTDDYQNRSGTITKYVLEHNDVTVPSDRQKKTYLRNNGKLWYTDYVNIKLVPVEDKKKWICPYCGDKYNYNRRHKTEIINHLKDEHGVSLSEHLKEHPEDTNFLSFANQTYNLQLLDDKDKFVTCAICGKKLARIDWKHLRTHGITKEEYIFKYGQETVCTSTKNKLRSLIRKVNETMEFHNVSNAENEIKKYISDNGIEVYEKRKIVDGHEIDIYLPSLNLGIEYNGLYYHTEQFKNGHNYHIDKTIACRRNGIKLIQVFEDEYTTHKDLVLSKIGHIIGNDVGKERIMGRKCTVREIDIITCKKFLNVNHIQGNGMGSVRLGAFYGETIVAAMVFKRLSFNNWELVRSASDINYRCQGVCGKLFKYFVNHFDPSNVKSFADRRWTVNEQNNVYVKMGFVFDGYTRPDYRYVGKLYNSRRRVHKFRLRKKFMLRMDNGHVLTPDMTEHEMALKIGMYRIYDCGLIRYVWKNPRKIIQKK